MRRRTTLLAAALASLALAAPASALAACGGSDLVPDAGNVGTVGQATLCLINGERAAQGLSAVGENARLTAASAAFSGRMVAEQFFDHVGPDGSTLLTRLTAAGYIDDGADWAAGENIAWGQGSLATPRSIVAAWMASPGHRANILNGDYTQIGLGIAVGSPVDTSWGATYTTDFGSSGGSAAGTVVDRSAPSSAARTHAATARGTARKKAAAAARRRCARARAAAKSHGRKARPRACAAHARSARKR